VCGNDCSFANAAATCDACDCTADPDCKGCDAGGAGGHKCVMGACIANPNPALNAVFVDLDGDPTKVIEVISIGKHCLLGANAGLGISLGDDCVVEAGLYVTAGTKVALPDGTSVKARELSGGTNMLFRRNSVTGAVEVVSRDGRGIALNEDLHAN